MVFGDSPWHHGPGHTEAYYHFAAPRYEEVVASLNAIGARVISIVNHPEPRLGYAEIARDTGAVRTDGSPLLFSIPASGTGLGASVIDAVAQLVGGTPQDVSTTTENVAGNPDEFDARGFIEAIRPLEGYGSDGVAGPRPGISYASRDESTFYGVIPGTMVEFEVDFWNDVRPAAERAQVFQARIVVMGNGVARLDERRVFIVVPPEGTIILI